MQDGRSRAGNQSGGQMRSWLDDPEEPDDDNDYGDDDDDEEGAVTIGGCAADGGA